MTDLPLAGDTPAQLPTDVDPDVVDGMARLAKLRVIEDQVRDLTP